MKRIFLISILALAFALPAQAASTTDTLLQRIGANYGNGVDAFTLNAISGIVVTTDAITAQVADATDLWTIDSDAAATPSPITVTLTAAVTGTVDYNATTDVWTIAVNGSTSRTADCTGITVTACVALINALDISDGTPVPTVVATVTNNMGFSRPEDIAAEDNAAGATTLVFTTAMDAGTGGDAYVDCTGLTLDGCVALLNSLDNLGGITADYTFTVEGTQNNDLANGANDIADVGPTDLTSLMQFPYTSDDPSAAYVENDDFKSVGYISAVMDATGNTGVINIYDGSTLIWVSAVMTDTVRTEYNFNPAITATGSNNLTVQMYHPGAMIVNTLMYVLGQD